MPVTYCEQRPYRPADKLCQVGDVKNIYTLHIPRNLLVALWLRHLA